MANRISKHAREELIGVLRVRYRDSPRNQRTMILEEFSELTGLHLKHAIRLLRRQASCRSPRQGYGRRVYDEAVREALVVVWEAVDRICGKRLKAVLPNLADAMERHGHLQLDPEVRRCLLQASAATLDRLLRPIRKVAKPYRRSRRRARKLSCLVRVRTFSDWNDPPPGYLEIDFVEHNGGLTAGACAHSLASVDICSGWVESVPLLAKSQAWIEQKNGAVIRRFVGNDRYAGVVAGQVLAHLYQAVRLYVNFFQPSFKLLEKEKHGAKMKKWYEKPKTPCEQLLNHPAVPDDVKEKLELQRKRPSTRRRCFIVFGKNRRPWRLWLSARTT
ncbi:MAG: hypothetical protein IMZ53_01610 [Thermoplasmata archaeon]|nr:hypothetical protein [Thermoplasmata archaeon]